MMFKNLCIYRLPAPFMTGSLGLSSFEEDVSGNALRACAAALSAGLDDKEDGRC